MVFVSSYPHSWPVYATLQRKQHLGIALPLAILEIGFLPRVMTTVLHMVLQNEKDFERFLIWKVFTRWLINHFPSFFSWKYCLWDTGYIEDDYFMVGGLNGSCTSEEIVMNFERDNKAIVSQVLTM